MLLEPDVVVVRIEEYGYNIRRIEEYGYNIRRIEVGNLVVLS